MTIKKIISNGSMMTAVLTLTACGPELAELAQSPEFAALSEDADALRTEAEALFDSEGFSEPASLPMNTTATYTGFIGLDTDDVSTIGELELTADFGTDQISGSATNFASEDTNYSGSLTISNGTGIDRLADLNNFDYTFDADIAGTLTGDGEDFVIGGLLEGDFIGNNQEYVGGIVTGTVETNEGDQDITGEFGAEQ